MPIFQQIIWGALTAQRHLGLSVVLSLIFAGSGAFADRLPANKRLKRRSREPASASAVHWDELAQSPRAVVGYLGIYDAGLYPQPIVAGADYRVTLQENPRVALRAGLLYWTTSSWSYGVNASLLDLTVGAGYVWTLKRVEIEGGGRFGYDSFTASAKFRGWTVFNESGNSLVLGPYAAGAFKLTHEWSLGVEFRIPYYLSGGGLMLNHPYILSQARYHF